MGLRSSREEANDNGNSDQTNEKKQRMCCGVAGDEKDNIDQLIDEILRSGTYGEAELDKQLAPGVRIVKLSPKETGFPAWKRDKEEYPDDADQDRGHADWLVPEGASNSSARILYTHGGGYEYYSPQDMYRPCTTRLAAATGMPL